MKAIIYQKATWEQSRIRLILGDKCKKAINVKIFILLLHSIQGCQLVCTVQIDENYNFPFGVAKFDFILPSPSRFNGTVRISQKLNETLLVYIYLNKCALQYCRHHRHVCVYRSVTDDMIITRHRTFLLQKLSQERKSYSLCCV